QQGHERHDRLPRAWPRAVARGTAQRTAGLCQHLVGRLHHRLLEVLGRPARRQPRRDLLFWGGILGRQRHRPQDVSPVPTARETMAAGGWYSFADAELDALRATTAEALFSYNHLPPAQRGDIAP